MPLPSVNVLDASGAPTTVPTLRSGRAAAADSAGVALSTEDLAQLSAVVAGLADVVAALGATLDVTLTGGSATVSGSVTMDGPLPAGANNIGDVDVLTVPTIATSTRALDYANGVTVTAGATSSASAAIAASEICVHNAGAVRAYIRQGAATPTASVAATSLALEAGEKIWLRHTSGHMVAAIRDGASDCAIRITPVA